MKTNGDFCPLQRQMQQNTATVAKKGFLAFVCERGRGCLVRGGRGFRICFCITGRGRGGARRSPKKKYKELEEI